VERFLFDEADLRARTGGKWRMFPPDVLPAFVAEMDFKVAPAIQEAIRGYVDRLDYGYGQFTDPELLYKAFSSYMNRRYGWQPDPANMVATTDVVQGLVSVLDAFSERGAGVIAQTPVYPPFLMSIEWTSRRLIENPLVDDGTRYVVDLDGLERAAEHASMLFICNPQNPTGRVFEQAELEAIAAIAGAHDLTIISDEIHSDLVYPGRKHIPMATIAGAAERTVTLTSATKGFNIPGLRAAVAHFGSAELKARFDSRIAPHLLGGPNRIGMAATIAAWTDADDWLGEVMAYLDGNRRRVAEWAAANGFGHHMPEATYLAWLDCTHMAVPEGQKPQEHLLERARVALSSGADFGSPGKGHVRLNFGTSTVILEGILGRLAGATV
jgi:cysteine-S-conjugate beta-lyase